MAYHGIYSHQSQPSPQQHQQLPPLPPGYRFYPTEEELVRFYLRNKLQGTRTLEMERFIPVVDVYRYEPSQLPQKSGETNIRDPEQWFFFCPRQEREAHGGRPTRITPSGYWKATGTTSYVYPSSSDAASAAGDGYCLGHGPIAVKKTMVFYEGRAPHGTRTVWKMNEYRAIANSDSNLPASPAPPKLQNDFSICRLYVKSNSLRSFDRRPSAVGSSPSSADHMQAAGGVDGNRNNPSGVQPPAQRTLTPASLDGSPDNNNNGPASEELVDIRMLEEINWDFVLNPF